MSAQMLTAAGSYVALERRSRYSTFFSSKNTSTCFSLRKSETPYHRELTVHKTQLQQPMPERRRRARCARVATSGSAHATRLYATHTYIHNTHTQKLSNGNGTEKKKDENTGVGEEQRHSVRKSSASAGPHARTSTSTRRSSVAAPSSDASSIIGAPSRMCENDFRPKPKQFLCKVNEC